MHASIINVHIACTAKISSGQIDDNFRITFVIDMEEGPNLQSRQSDGNRQEISVYFMNKNLALKKKLIHSFIFSHHSHSLTLLTHLIMHTKSHPLNATNSLSLTQALALINSDTHSLRCSLSLTQILTFIC